MISLFIQEYEKHTLREWISYFGLRRDEVVKIFRSLKYAGVLYKARSTDRKPFNVDLDNDDLLYEISSTDDKSLYYFKFVGLIIVQGCVLKCYPKYLASKSNLENQFKQVIQVLRKYDSEKEYIYDFDEDGGNKSARCLPFMLSFLWDYYDFGLYSNTEYVLEYNGDGDILWDRTIQETLCFTDENTPYYVDVVTRKNCFKEMDYFKELHSYILTYCSNELEKLGLLDLFDITPVDLTDKQEEDFGSRDYILERIEYELNIQFSSRKQYLLHSMKSFFLNKIDLIDNPLGVTLGTTAFYDVWEKVCQKVFVSQLSKPFKYILDSVPAEYNPYDSFSTLIENPKWHMENGINIVFKDTLIPDYIAIYNQTFIILDAKYYLPQADGSGFPGIEAITKQYMYELAYKDFLKKFPDLKVVNCFIFPTENDSVENCGYMYLNMYRNINDGLHDILIRKVPAAYLFECYLSGKTLSFDYLNL